MKQILFLLFPGFEMLDFSGPLQTFFEAKARGCDLKIAHCSWQSEVTASQGIELHKVGHFSQLHVNAEDIIIVPGLEHRAYTNNALAKVPRAVFDWLIRARENKAVLCSICSGAFVLAHAGLLNNKKCTTHWTRTKELAQTCPDAHVETDKLFVHDKGIYTSAGIASGIDLSLALIEEHFGPNMTAKVARDLVVYMRRDSRHHQDSIYLDYRDHINPVIHRLQDFLISHPGDNAGIEELAERFGLSPRNLTRLFKKACGITIKQYRTLVALEHARNLMQSPDLCIESIANQCGFHDAKQLRRLWHKHFGTAPSRYRSRRP